MRLHHQISFAVSLALASVCFAQVGGGQERASTDQAGRNHVVVTPDEVKWGPSPPSLPPGSQMAVLEGDPTKSGAPFTLRAKLPDGFRVPPHWHPTDEHITVLAGTFGVGLGEKLDQAKGHELTAGSFAKMPKEVRHFAWAKGETVIQVHGVGPFAITYVNPADDPRRKAGSQ